MFQGFTNETSAFLWDLRFHNERPWFQAHKEDFERVLNQPFRALAADTLAEMRRRQPEEDHQIHISRIYRDARRLFGRGPYKENLWFILTKGSPDREGPAFWFELSAATYSYGLGYWDARPAEMECFRRRVDAAPARFARLAEEIQKDGRFRLLGTEYRRPKGDYPEPIASWYNRKYLAIEVLRDFGGDLFRPELPRILADTFESLDPMYRFLREVHQSAVAQEQRPVTGRSHGEE